MTDPPPSILNSGVQQRISACQPVLKRKLQLLSGSGVRPSFRVNSSLSLGKRVPVVGDPR